MSEQQIAATEAPVSNGTMPSDADDAPQQADYSEYEDRAKELGHVPLKDWKGPQEKWVNPKDFVERWGPTLPIVRKENKKHVEDIQRLKQELKARDERLAALEKREAERDQARGQIEESSLQQELAQANADGDHRRAAQAQAELTKLYIKQSVPRETPREAPADDGAAQSRYINQLMTDFVGANPVFAQSDMQQVLAEEISVVKSVNPQMSPEDLLARAKDRAKRIYPEKFQQKRAPAMAEMNGAPARGGSDGHSWDDLKPDAKAALNRLIENVPQYKAMKKDEARKIVLANKDQFVQIATDRLLTYALGRGLDHNDMPTIRKIARESAPSNYNFSTLVLNVVKSMPFQMRRAPKPQEVSVN